MLKKSKRNIRYIVIHCSATPEGYNFDASDIDYWHKQRGWRGIGYNYVIKLDGTLEIGRDVDIIPAQVKGYNKHAVAICYIGGLNRNGKPKDTRTVFQKQALQRLVLKLKALYPTAKVLGHRDFPGVRKACPCFNVKKEFRGKN